MTFLKNKFYLLLVIFSLLVNSCVEDSPLSDIELDDPSLVKPVITINKDVTSNVILYSNTTWLFDKNFNSIELKSGEVKMNDVAMKLKKGLNKEPYYVAEPFDYNTFKFNSSYESKISLADGRVYSSSVTTRAKDLYFLNVPYEHNKYENLNISWADAANDEKLQLTLVVSGSSDTNTYVSTHVINIPNPSDGRYTISHSYFADSPLINKVDITLEAIKTGTISSSFMSGSKITSTISITGNVKLK